MKSPRRVSCVGAGWCGLAVPLVGSLLAVAVAGCHPTSRTGERSVRPGVNDAYKNADVDKWVVRFESESREIFTQRREIVNALKIRPGTTMADIGAGTGFMTMLFSEAVGPGGKVFAVDITPEFLERIDELAAERGLKNVETVRCSADSVELEANSIDLAFICDTYHHFEFPQSTLASIHRALKPGGEVAVIDFIRKPGESREWVIGHVRLGREKVAGEFIAAGFERLPDPPVVAGLEENYLERFRKVEGGE